MNIDNNTTQIIIAIIGIVAVGGTIVAVKIRKSKRNNNTVTQNNNTVTNGDIVGGDKIIK